MKSASVGLNSIFVFVRKHWFKFFAVAIYIFFASFYMGGAFYDCTTSVNGFGDSTAGPIWRNSLKPDQPVLGGFEKSTNYPTGESLYSPVGYAVLVQSTFMDTASQVVGPVCAYNIYNIFGYLSTSILMFAFILYLIRSRWIALLAGYAVAFTPYIQVKIGAHPSYGYVSILIGILWLLIHFITYRKKRHAIFLAIVLGICAYFDPYFILLAITIIGSVLFVWLIRSMRVRKKSPAKLSAKQVVKWAKPFIIGLAVFALIITPLVVIRIKDANFINTSVGASRANNVLGAAMLCSNLPQDYVLPDPDNIFLNKVMGPKYKPTNIELRHWCGDAESRVSLSLTLIAVITVAVIIMGWERFNGRRLKLGSSLRYDPKLIVGSAVALGLFAFLLGLPPYINGVIMPSGVVIKITEIWRIFAREYLLVNLGLVILAAIALKYFANSKLLKDKLLLKALILVFVILGVMGEYQVTKPFHPKIFSYSNDVPEVYRQIRDNKDIEALAEYPIDRAGIEYDSIVYYLTMQGVHGKSLFNTVNIPGTRENLHMALRDLSDPQTIPALRELGVRYVVVHGETRADLLAKTSGLQVIGYSNPTRYALTTVRADDNGGIILAKILDGPTTTNVLTIESGYVTNLEFVQSPIGIEYETASDVTLKVTPVNKAYGVVNDVCFELKMTSGQTQIPIVVKKNGEKVLEQKAGADYSLFRLEAKSNDIITVTNSQGHNMRLNNLGCAR